MEKQMKAWRLEKMGGKLELREIPVPEVRAGSVLIKVAVSALVSYLKNYTAGKLAVYNPPPQEFTMGSNAIGYVEAVGKDVWHLKPGQRVALSSHITARDNVKNPVMILLGITKNGDAALPAQLDWPDGTLAQYVLAPVESITALDGLDAYSDAQLSAITRFVVPYGGLLKGQLTAGETLVVNGATGSFGASAVFLGVAMGASRIIITGRNKAALEAVARKAGPRIIPVTLQGDVRADAKAIREACDGGADIAFDMVGNAGDPNSTLAALFSLVPGGRLVIMGSMGVDLPLPYTYVMLNSWSVIGNFMYPKDAIRKMLELVKSGQLPIDVIEPKVFPMSALDKAMDAAAAAGNLENVMIDCQS
ncbi:alcohol dehydrogenase [Chitinophaga ginsengisegetis]|uniref:Alcohol dehydrogenase n=1 Tax=Chitinophaga ginsengisegetis TaxID=393003 RepID=A0A1T5NK15_9BACT|nr:zinc-binding dehydrogenase [Chitinophaga ginsengisegetis]SKD00528.1 alcohol dehydrogenase [Chitinophaga ginsengisegetis]